MNQNSSRSYDLLWLSLTLLILIPIALLLSIPPHDYWFYVRIGKDIVQTGVIPRVDTFSFTYPGQPIFYQPWLSAVIFWFAYSWGGATLTFLLRALCIAVAYGLTWALMRLIGTEVKLAAFLTIILGLSSSMNWSMRPQILAYPLFVIVLWVMWNWQHGRATWIWLLPLITLLWSNIHGSFILAFVLMGSALVFGAGDRKKLGLWFVFSLLATILNPRGVFVWQFVLDMLNSPSDQLFATEWMPPVNAGWQMNIFFAWLLLFIPLVAFSPRRLSVLEWVWTLGFGWLALSGLRYVIWFMIIMAILSSALLGELLRSFKRQVVPVNPNPTFNYILASVILILPFMVLPGIRESWWKDAPSAYNEAATPIAATQWLDAHSDIAGPLFAEYTFGSYLIFALPSRLLWIDNRFNAYPPEHWEDYQTISSAKYRWDVLLDKDKINLLMLSLSTQRILVEAVEDSAQWCEQYRDKTAVIFSRCEPFP